MLVNDTRNAHTLPLDYGIDGDRPRIGNYGRPLRQLHFQRAELGLDDDRAFRPIEGDVCDHTLDLRVVAGGKHRSVGGLGPREERRHDQNRNQRHDRERGSRTEGDERSCTQPVAQAAPHTPAEGCRGDCGTTSGGEVTLEAGAGDGQRPLNFDVDGIGAGAEVCGGRQKARDLSALRGRRRSRNGARAEGLVEKLVDPVRRHRSPPVRSPRQRAHAAWRRARDAAGS